MRGICTMKQKNLICILLILAMSIVPVFAASCGDGKGGTIDDEEKNGGAGEDQSNEDDTLLDEAGEKLLYDPKFSPVDMGGYEFTVSTRDDDMPYHLYPAHTRDIYAEAENGDLINDAVYRRNTAIEEKYNCKIVMMAYPETNEAAGNQIVEKSAKAGDKSFDLITTHMMMGFNTATMGAFYDIASFPNIDIRKPYWNHGANEGCSVGHKLYIGLSDFSISSNESLYCIFFNKQLAQNYGMEDPYKLVGENNWTFDKFNQLIRQGYSDLNGNAKVDADDQFGYVNSNSLNFLWAGGGQMTKKDEDDIPYFDFMSQRVIDIYAKALDITINDFTYSSGQWHIEPSIGIFQEGRTLFFSNQLCRVNNLRATEFEFGIVPYPKFDSAQERYYSYVDGHASMMAIPINLPNLEWTGMLIEELSYISYKDIMPVYYDVVLNVKLVRDEESVEMLKILFDSKVFDPAYVMGLGLWTTWITNIESKKTEIVSTYEKMENSLNRDMTKKIDALLALE